ELIPVDGVVTSGSSSVSEADLTGEPVPVRKTSGMLVLSGSVNLDGVLEMRADKRSAESKYAQIVRLVEEAQTQKAPIHRLADRYSIGFTIAALAIAGLAWGLSGESVYALAVMVVATPCPLILATPIAIMSGIDLAARNGMIAKSGAAIEQLGEVDIAVFDKTGTLTLGRPKVTAIVLAEQEKQRVLAVEDGHEMCRTPAEYDENTLLRLAASVEPLSLCSERERRVDAGQICSFIAVDKQLEGLLVLEDVPRADLSQFSEDLRAAGIKETILLTGDSEVVARQIGEIARVDRVVAR